MASFGTRHWAWKPVLTLAALSLASLPLHAFAQAPEPAGQPLAFATISIKPIDSTPGAAHVVGVKVLPGGQVTITSYTLKGLIGLAYHLRAWQVTGGDTWTETDQYDLDAKAPEGTYDLRYSALTIEDEHLRQMLQTLLLQRFQLKFHRDSKSGNDYALEKSGKPITLVPTTLRLAKYYGEGFSGNVGHIMGKGWTLYNTSMSQLAGFLSDAYQCPVLDHTGLDGFYDFEPKTPESDAEFQKPVDESIKPALAEMGLSLKKSWGPIETFVIDHTDNPFPSQ